MGSGLTFRHSSHRRQKDQKKGQIYFYGCYSKINLSPFVPYVRKRTLLNNMRYRSVLMSVEDLVRQKHAAEHSLKEYLFLVSTMSNEEIELAMGRLPESSGGTLLIRMPSLEN